MSSAGFLSFLPSCPATFCGSTPQSTKIYIKDILHRTAQETKPSMIFCIYWPFALTSLTMTWIREQKRNFERMAKKIERHRNALGRNTQREIKAGLVLNSFRNKHLPYPPTDVFIFWPIIINPGEFDEEQRHIPQFQWKNSTCNLS